jgi:hypothetical protein
MYELSVKDEELLDGYEGVSLDVYEKRIIPLELITSSSNGEAANKIVDALVYIDFARTRRDLPKTEYIHRINMGVKDALEKGVPQSYIDTYFRSFIPPE